MVMDLGLMQGLSLIRRDWLYRNRAHYLISHPDVERSVSGAQKSKAKLNLLVVDLEQTTSHF